VVIKLHLLIPSYMNFRISDEYKCQDFTHVKSQFDSFQFSKQEILKNKKENVVVSVCCACWCCHWRQAAVSLGFLSRGIGAMDG
jgi:hypothetical protein